jgi:N-acetylmuramoyl-L-alanine amidase
MVMAACKHFHRSALGSALALIAALLLIGNAPAIAAEHELFAPFQEVIVLDPGHGGDDIGARGPEGTLEKAVALELARILAAQLQHRYRVVLTRTDDSRMSLENRTASANNRKADLFISIHTGGSTAHSTSGTTVYYYQPFSEQTRSLPPADSDAAANTAAPILWDRVQSRYTEKSRNIAGLINAHFNTSGAAGESRIAGAPLAVLKGADMPAILIEFGYITNPAEEKLLQDKRFLIGLALAVHQAIDEYFEQDR